MMAMPGLPIVLKYASLSETEQISGAAVQPSCPGIKKGDGFIARNPSPPLHLDNRRYGRSPFRRHVDSLLGRH
jgi:hypothetical protein